MIELNEAENILKSFYLGIVADTISNQDKKTIRGKTFYRGVKPYQKKEAKTGRNELCPCGSGKKYKHCCGK